MTPNDYKLAYGKTFVSDPGPHLFEKVPRSDDLCRICAKGELEHKSEAALKLERLKTGERQ